MKTNTILIVSIFLLAFITISQTVSAQKILTAKSHSEIQTDRSTLELMNLIAYSFIRDNPLSAGEYGKGDWTAVKNSSNPQIMWWLYPTGVTLLAMQQLFDISQDPKLLEYVSSYANIAADQYAYLRWQTMKFGKPYNYGPLKNLCRLDMLDDYGAIGAAFLECKMRHNMKFSDNLNDLIGILDNQIVNVQYRLKDGSFWRPNSPDGPTIWGDDLFMGLPFLVRLAQYKKDPKLFDDAVLQIINYSNYLQDSDGVFFHAYFVDKKTHNGIKWGRVNGWITVAMAQVLTYLPLDHPKRDQVLKIYKKHIDGLIKLQSADGLWNQVLDHPELSWGTETTCSAQYTFSIARGINRGWLDASYIPVVKKSLHGLSDYSRITKNGELLKVCPSTSIGLNLDYYNSLVPEQEGHTAHHGDGLILLALTEMHVLLENVGKHTKR
ncbi:MAG: hypothetical protein GZ094_08295 [Mariniphaga sp.]|nr:hypothetical protein [Mariniphaga sp.]